MLLQFFASEEGTVQFRYDFLFFGRQFVWVLWIYRREVAILHRIFLSVDCDDATFMVDAVEQQTVVHLEFRTAANGLSFQLELDDTDSLVHLSQESERLRVADGFSWNRSQTEQCTWVVGIGFHGEGSQRQQVDAIAVFQYACVAEAGHETYDIGYTNIVTGSSTHPQNIMIAPLDIPIMVIAEDIHDMMRSVSSVEDVAQDMERVDGQSLDQVTECCNESVGTAGTDNGIDDHFRICLLVGKHGVFMQQFLDDVRELFRKRLAYFGTGILGGNVLANSHQLVQGSQIPAVQIRFGCFYQVQLLFRIIY